MKRPKDDPAAAAINDEFSGEGGTFEVRDGKRVRVSPPSQPHPEGDQPRDEHGRPIGPDGKPVPAAEQGA